MDNQQGQIQRLQKQISQQLTSQQIIPTLHQCIKQLVDNAIDAKASIIKIELQEYGKINFSVYDNGCGIKEVQKLGEGGNTSKLKLNQNQNNQDYLEGIRTLGFRGQAVNSIANLCKQMIIHTAYQQQDDQGPKIIQTKYSVTKRAIIQKKESFLQQTFTKISAEGLFSNLPVRKHQLDSKPKQNIKKVYQQIFQISLIYPQVTFILTNIVEGRQEILLNIQKYNSGSNKKSTKIKNQHQSDYFHTDISRQAWKQRIQICFPNKMEDCLTFVTSKNIQGFILNTIDSGSSKKNLRFNKNYQYTFINRRPINPIKQICKIFDGYYKKYNPYTKYVFFLNLKIQPHQIDVNLTPNKRDIFIKKQTLQSILKQIKTLIEKQVIQKITNLEDYKQAKIRKSQSKSQKLNQQEQIKEQQDQQEEIVERFNKNDKKKITQEQDSINIRKQVFRSGISQSIQDKSMRQNYLANYKPLTSQQNNSIIQELNKRMNNAKIGIGQNSKPIKDLIDKNKQQNNSKKVMISDRDQKQQQEEPNSQSEERQKQEEKQQIKNKNQKQSYIMPTKNRNELRNSIFQSLNQAANGKPRLSSSQFASKKKTKSKQVIKVLSDEQIDEKFGLQIIDEKDHKLVKKENQKIKIQDSHITQKIQIQNQNYQNQIPQSKVQNNQIHSNNQFCSKNKRHHQSNILNNQPQDKHTLNVTSPKHKMESQFLKQLSQQSQQHPNNPLHYITQQNRGQISKQDFKKFHIHGQFNKGFILCSLLQKQFLYIVDQHASQQKRLFQTYMDSKPEFYYLSKQVQITPLQVDQIQMARNQLIKSGFSFEIINRTTLRLNKCPIHFKRNFGLEEFMQIVETNKNIKEIPSFYNSAASKACRTAVMIGDDLVKSKMIDIVHRMADLKSPWNCPHGRPSLVSLGSFKSIVGNIKPPVKRKYNF